jgi:putative membrane protein
VYLGVAIAAHAVISQLMYGGFWVDIHAPIYQVQAGAEIMYYGGDIAELLLAAALVATWRPEHRRQTTRSTLAEWEQNADPASSGRRERSAQ